jgi:fumarate reductase subunit C
MSEARLFLLQRASAMLLAPLVLVHLGLILYAVRGGLSAAEILARTQGSVGWAAFYGLFVLAAAVHAPIGLRAVLREWTGWRGLGLDLAMLILGGVLLVLGLRAVWAVVA